MQAQFENLTFDQAMRLSAELRAEGLVGISLFHRHEYDRIEADEGCYVVFAYSKFCGSTSGTANRNAIGVTQ